MANFLFENKKIGVPVTEITLPRLTHAHTHTHADIYIRAHTYAYIHTQTPLSRSQARGLAFQEMRKKEGEE